VYSQLLQRQWGGTSAAPINITGATGIFINIIDRPGAGGSAGCGGTGGGFGISGLFVNNVPQPGFAPGGGGCGGSAAAGDYDGSGTTGGNVYY